MSTLSKTLEEIGVEHTNIVHQKTKIWFFYNQGNDKAPLLAGDERSVLLKSSSIKHTSIFLHGTMTEDSLGLITKKHFLVVFAHNPIVNIIPLRYNYANLLIPVSQYVSNSLISHGFRGKVLAFPMYYALPNPPRYAGNIEHVNANNIIEWDTSKPRDLILSFLEKIRAYNPVNNFGNHLTNGLKIGIVSRLASIKRFPKLLNKLVPILLNHPSISLHIYGSGSYREVMNIQIATTPIKERVKFHGWQANPWIAYQNIDYLLLGRPDYEALGLNIIEAQSIGIPPLAINGGPFPEIIDDGKTGWFYSDPEDDNGESFNALTKQLINSTNKIDPRNDSKKMNMFTKENFRERARSMMDEVFEHHHP